MLLCSFNAFGQLDNKYPPKVAARYMKLTSEKDSFICYYKTCSGCVSGSNKSLLLLYKQNGRYYNECFIWSIESLKVIKHKKSRYRSRSVAQLYNFVSENLGVLKNYDGYKDIEAAMASKQKNDTATNGRIYPSLRNHGVSAAYFVKFGDISIRTGTSFTEEESYLIKNFPEVGCLLLLLECCFLE